MPVTISGNPKENANGINVPTDVVSGNRQAWRPTKARGRCGGGSLSPRGEKLRESLISILLSVLWI
jgi:hypothetical protein